MTSTPRTGFSLGLWWKQHRKMILPPIFGIGGFLLFWQLSSRLGLTKLNGPLCLWTDERSRELLLYPFFDRGGLDKGLFLHTMSSLTRVGIGYINWRQLSALRWASPSDSTSPSIAPLIPCFSS